ncbi:DUF1671-domain-containing protein [Pseudovirgaria hyperparasitica]|uniref:DUF1671-domain-containing protein n=1 Tax=Pseudovirgaria hyperparasitica TaxID=470096 RepID=A0A6A6W259_9PEZI|nr:DUF1671-domain-containing protein [Pseudovirgaria hyperparasitica]KAF2756199.1 DUF1671-domain-containing protein [Pseudovirgaria hyperparasitica]
MAPSLVECPFCSAAFSQDDVYWLQLHIEESHTPDSAFRIAPEDDADSASASTTFQVSGALADCDDDDHTFVDCPECGEYVLLDDYNDHLDLHDVEKHNTYLPSSSSTSSTTRSKHHDMRSNPSLLNENISMNISGQLPSQKRRHSSSGSRSSLSRSVLTCTPSTTSKARISKRIKSARLGKKELGPYAWEDRMPAWLEKKLADGPKISIVNRIGGDGRLIKQEVVENETPGIPSILAQLSHVDRSVRKAYYCHPSTVHICHTPKEGGFCGYRNLQMLISYIQGARAQGHTEFPGRTPTILALQDIIEDAWDKGINEVARVQTGGIRKTRKWIGTPEAQSVLVNLQIDSGVQVFSDGQRGSALDQLLIFVESYFQQFVTDADQKVHRTLAPPIYFQHPGHSLTIVGFERRKDGSCNLVVFDPMFRTSPSMHRLLGRQNIASPRPEVMDAYRRDARKLRKHRDFEILMLTAAPPQFPAWAIMAQFPAHRFVYVFLRFSSVSNHGGPGYDVYPEHHFLSAFPWQSFGSLFMTDEGRFARVPPPLSPYLQMLMRCQFRGTPPPVPETVQQLLSYQDVAKPEECGLLPVKMLTESEMEEVLFWQGCGTPSCTFGCGKERAGEIEAARKLFRPEEIVT